MKLDAQTAFYCFGLKQKYMEKNQDLDKNIQNDDKTVQNQQQAQDEQGIPDLFLPIRNYIASKTPQNPKIKIAIIVLMFALCALLFSNILQAQFSAMQKVILSVVMFIICSETARAIMNWDGFYGLIIFKDRHTLSWIDRQAKRYEQIWTALCDIGLVLGYGFFSWLMISQDQKSNKTRLVTMYVGGILALFLFSTFVSPIAALVINSMLFSSTDTASATSQLNDALGTYKQTQIDLSFIGIDTSINPIALFVMLVVLVFGLAGSVYFSLLMYAVIIFPKILVSVVSFLTSLVGVGEFNQNDLPAPGGSPILPGINLPLVEGIIALASVLIVHEMSHGLLARIADVKLDSAGVVLFGLIPFGAFVEPDEKQMSKIKKYEENRILVAGSASNILLSIISFFALTTIVFLTYDLRSEGYVVDSGNLPKGVIIQKIAGVQYYGQNLSLAPNTQVEIITDEETFFRTTDENGKIGINMNYVNKNASGFSFKYKSGYGWIEFVLNTLGLMFAINMFVGMINLLPLPLFDGNRLMLNAIGDGKLAFAISALCAGSFIVNMLPWIFK